ncbi:MAG: tRNA lysidine(34) synthetase TilS [Clostridia bacterium]|nr:tRNA lysidine(34) synthetase TilS [Clostridia bacterium]
MDVFIQKVLNTIEQYELLQADDLVYVALSGGADSIALLHCMCVLRDTLKLSGVRALHVNHGLRGDESDEDMRFVQRVCENMRVPLTVSCVDVANEAETARKGLEETGRRLRYAFFENAITGKNNAKIATAHTADDCAETVLLNMARGCSMRGVCGIPINR